MKRTSVSDRARDSCRGALNSLRCSEGVLPHVQHNETFAPKRGIDPTSASDVTGDLCGPVAAIRAGQRPPTRTTRVPEAAVHEHGHPCLDEDEVGSAGKLSRMERPASDSATNQGQSQAPLGAPITARAHERHLAAALERRHRPVRCLLPRVLHPSHQPT